MQATSTSQKIQQSQQAAKNATQTTTSSNNLDFFQLPKKYQRRAIPSDEIDAINVTKANNIFFFYENKFIILFFFFFNLSLEDFEINSNGKLQCLLLRLKSTHKTCYFILFFIN